MSGLDNLSIPGVDFAAGTITAPLWAGGVAAGLVLVLLILAMFRAGLSAVIGSVFRIVLVVLAVGLAWTFLSRFAERDRLDERRALDQRLGDLTARETAPSSTLGCLDAGLGDTVEGSCEKLVFAGPETVAAASAYVAARWSLLVDGLDYARNKDASYEPALEGLRRAIEADRFGFVAQLLAVRESCTSAKCEALTLLRDANRVRANLGERTYDGLVARNAAAWPARVPRPGTPTAAAPGGPVPAGGINFPSAASIPPVSIMNSEPPAPAATPGTGTAPAAAAPVPQRRPAPAPRPPAPRAAQPVPLTPPPGAASPPRQQ